MRQGRHHQAQKSISTTFPLKQENKPSIIDHERVSDGKSTFSGPTELRLPVPSNTDDDMIRRIDAYLEKNRP